MLFETFFTHFPMWSLTLLTLLGGSTPVDFRQDTEPIYAVGDVRFVCNFAVFEGDSGMLSLEVHYKLPFRQLSFKRLDPTYHASYESALFLSETKRRGVHFGESWKREYEVGSYREAHAVDRYIADSISLSIEPGVYDLTFHVRDLVSRKKGEVERKGLRIVLDDDRPLRRSSLVLAHGPREKEVFRGEGEADLVPNPDNIFFESDRFLYLFYEIYSARSPGEEEFDEHVELLDGSGKAVLTQDAGDAHGREARRRIFRLPLGDVPYGFYRVVVSGGKGAVPVFTTSRELQIRSRFFPYPFDIDIVLNYLKYYMWGRGLAAIEGLQGDKQKAQFWHDFWNAKRPDLGSPSPEMFEEFLDRMFAVDAQYTDSKGSMISDRAVAYMRFGPPDEIERHPFDRDARAYEDWYYYSKALQLRFVDEKGIGDYRILDDRMRTLLLSH